MDVEDSSNVSAPAASDAVVLVHDPDPAKPQQSEPLLSSQPATLASSSTSSSSTTSSFVASSTYSHILQSSSPFSTESPTPPSSS